MSLTLDGTLQTRLDGIERQPIAQIITTSFASSIPFNGNYFDISDGTLLGADIKLLSTGALAVVTSYYDTQETYRYMYTDVDRTYWTENIITYTAINGNPKFVTLCEGPDNDLRVAYVYSDVTLKRIAVSVISPDGSYTDSATTIFTYGYNDTPNGLYLIYNDVTATYQLFTSFYDTSLTSNYIYMKEGATIAALAAAGWNDITPASIGNDYAYKNVHVFKLSDDDLALSFEVVEATDEASGFETSNVYYMISQDDGATWSVPTAVTSFTGVGQSGIHPCIAEKTANVFLTYSEVRSFLVFDADTENIEMDSGTALCAQNVHIYNGKIYTSAALTSIGLKELQGFYVIDPADMSIEAQWTSTTTPGYDAGLLDYHSWWTSLKGDGKYMARYVAGWDVDSCWGEIILITYDGVTNTVTQYTFGNGDVEQHPAYGWPINVIIPDKNSTSYISIKSCLIDATREKMFVVFEEAAGYGAIGVGYIDLTESPDPSTGYYTWNEIWYKTSTEIKDEFGWGTSYATDGFLRASYAPDTGWITLCFERTGGFCHGGIIIVDTDTGVVQFQGSYDTDSNIPYEGFISAATYGQIIYGSFTYSALGGQSACRGLWIYNLVSGTRVLARPGYETKDQYTFVDYDFSDIANNYVWLASTDGAVRYSTGTQYFEKWGEDEIPGFNMRDDEALTWIIAYDTTNEDVYVNKYASDTYWSGMRRFNVNGFYYKGKYATGSKSGTDLQLATASDLTLGNYETEIVTAVDESDVLWAVWDHIDNIDSDRDLIWDNDESETDVTDDLTDVLEIVHAIDTPSEIRFSLTNGHLYDPQNSLSNLSYMFKRGRKITCKLGENIGDSEYWEDQGSYIVEEIKLRYVRGEYPVMEVTARDMSSLWRDARIALTAYYDGDSPKAIVEDLLDDWTILEGADYTIPTFDASHEIWHQWSDESLYDIIKDILDHFGYTSFFTTAGVYTPKKLDFTKAIDHAYSDQTQIEEYSPDSSFSNFVNQIRVIGETHDYIDVVYDPELIDTINGTCGWWNQTIEHTIYYNSDRTKTCRNPYLNPIISTSDFQYFIFKGGGGEEITEVDVNGLYCVIEIEGPNLIPLVVGLSATALATGLTAVFCSYNCGPWVNATCILLSMLCYAVLATATYQIEVWAQPEGEERQSIQYIATDQEQMNIINQQPVIEEIEDALCYTMADCQRVAEFELNVLKYQRDRIQLTKLAHLQDELLDMISVKHPYTDITMQIMIASLRRTLVIRGDMKDTIEGWRIY